MLLSAFTVLRYVASAIAGFAIGKVSTRIAAVFLSFEMSRRFTRAWAL
jgi:hypothetical protein